MVINHLLTGMILQVGLTFPFFWFFFLAKIQEELFLLLR